MNIVADNAGFNISKPIISETDVLYWTRAVADELENVAANTEVGDREQQFFRSCCAIFGIVMAGIGTRAAAEDLLIEAATDSGYANHEPEQMMATLASAWNKATPTDLTKMRQQSTAPANANEMSTRDPAITLVAGAASVVQQAGDVLEAFARQNSDEPRLFQANTVITRLRSDEIGTRLEHLDKDALQHEINRVAHFVTMKRGHTGVPGSIVSHIAGAPEYNLPAILGVRCAPYFAADGRLVDQPGYDPGTGYFLELPPGLVIPKVAKHPTPEDTSRALRQLVEVFLDFPFRDRASKRAYLALLLLPFCRDFIDGPTPIHVIGKPAPGTGASLAVDVFAMIATGHTAAAQAEAENKAEFRKNLTAFLMSGAPYYYLDNLHQTLNDPAFAAALRHHILTVAVTLLHVAIAIATIAIIVRGQRWPWYGALMLGAMGATGAAYAYIG